MPKFSGLEAITSTVFELQESNQPDEHFTFNATKNGRTERWTAKFYKLEGEGTSLAEAMRDLANQLEGMDLFGSEKFVKAQLSRGRVRRCDYCGADIWFAKTRNDKWMPIDGTAVEAKELAGLRAFTVVSSGGEPRVFPLKAPQGPVWIAHPDICGVNADEPNSIVLKERWDVNREKFIEGAQHKALEGLQSVLEDLHEEKDDHAEATDI